MVGIINYYIHFSGGTNPKEVYGGEIYSSNRLTVEEAVNNSSVRFVGGSSIQGYYSDDTYTTQISGSTRVANISVYSEANIYVKVNTPPNVYTEIISDDVYVTSDESSVNFVLNKYIYKDKLTNISLDENITNIGGGAFKECYNLISAECPAVTSIGFNAFYYCRNLNAINCSNATSLGDNCFYNCASLENINLSPIVTSIGSSCFMGCSSLDSIEIPTGVTSLSQNCFRSCTSLVSVEIPDSVTSLGENCFYNCSKLVSVVISNNVTSLSQSCFYDCTSLTSIVIPDSVTSIYNYCFRGCESLAEIHFKRSTPATVNSSTAFIYLPRTCKIYVPTGSLNAYKSAANYPSASSYTYIEE